MAFHATNRSLDCHEGDSNPKGFFLQAVGKAALLAQCGFLVAGTSGRIITACKLPKHP
jgi:hypothetical protein